jgi:hypothetical protein
LASFKLFVPKSVVVHQEKRGIASGYGGYGGSSYGGHGHAGGYGVGYGGAAAIAQEAANVAKAAQNAQAGAAYQAAHQAQATLAAQAVHAAQQVLLLPTSTFDFNSRTFSNVACSPSSTRL